jgi:2-phosphosulfolactate phosphatase
MDTMKNSDRTVVIDCFPESVAKYRQGYAIVAIDVIRATTTAITAVAAGRRCFPAATLEEAQLLAWRLSGCLLVGEQNGITPEGFHVTNSPAELAGRQDNDRPMVLLSSAGTRLICGARGAEAVYLACFRNYGALGTYLASQHDRVAVIGAGTKHESREEDEMCCAWIAEQLLNAGYHAATANTLEMIERWSGKPAEASLVSNSVAYLRRSGQMRDMEFILSHVDDLDATFRLDGDEVVMERANATRATGLNSQSQVANW